MDRHPIDKLSAAMWRKAEKEKDDKSKMQFIVDQIVRFKDQELYDNEYWPELTEKGYETVGEFEEWKKVKNNFLDVNLYFIYFRKSISIRSLWSKLKLNMSRQSTTRRNCFLGPALRKRKELDVRGILCLEVLRVKLEI